MKRTTPRTPSYLDRIAAKAQQKEQAMSNDADDNLSAAHKAVVQDEADATVRHAALVATETAAARKAAELHAITQKASEDAALAAVLAPDAATAHATYWARFREFCGF